jgi:hypothetical protein
MNNLKNLLNKLYTNYNLLQLKRINTTLKDLCIDYEQLKYIEFGRLEAEEDNDYLSTAIVFTDSFIDVISLNYNYILSPKGAGKSATFNAIEKKLMPDHLFNYERKHFLFINKAFGFDKDYLSPSKFKHDLDSKNYIFAWALYFIFQIVENIKHKYSKYPYYNELIKKIKIISEFKEEFQLYNILDRLEELNISLSLNISGQELKLSPKIKKHNHVKNLDINYSLNAINDFYKSNNIKLNVLIDKVDNFVKQECYEIQKKFIQGLVDSVEEIRSLTNIQPILFLRTDLFYNLSIGLELDKARDRIKYLEWTKNEILLFIVRRLLSNDYILYNFMEYLKFHYKMNHQENSSLFIRIFSSSYDSLDRDLIRNLNQNLCERFILLFFNEEIIHHNLNLEEEKINFFDWLFTHFKDTNGYINPRCLVRFFNLLFSNQYKKYQNDIFQLNSTKYYFKASLSNNYIQFNIFDSYIILETYKKVQIEQLENISSLLNDKRLKLIFKSIIQIFFLNKVFKLEDINYKERNVEEIEYVKLVKYLEIYGVLKQTKFNEYTIPIFYTNPFI